MFQVAETRGRGQAKVTYSEMECFDMQLVEKPFR